MFDKMWRNDAMARKKCLPKRNLAEVTAAAGKLSNIYESSVCASYHFRTYREKNC